ncbi:unnamed protein product, partial [Soboliphyme baturini]|uniref:RGS domain-containing protein n=1 Tax=Soboliphyme baturini TaxID=241478 RepID=A0A183J119_9BILA
ERAFWDLHRPVVSDRSVAKLLWLRQYFEPGAVNTTEVDFRKLSRSSRLKIPSTCHLRPGSQRYSATIDYFRNEIQLLHACLARNPLKTSKVAEFMFSYSEQRYQFDPLLRSHEPNRWSSDTYDLFECDKTSDHVCPKRVRRWALSFDELLSDPVGRERFMKFLEKEYSGENLRFWEAAQSLRFSSCRFVPIRVTAIYNDFLGPNASSPVNVDSKVMDNTNRNLENPGRWSFDEALEHIYCLMKNDSYQRFIRSDNYKELLVGEKKKSSTKVSGLRSVISFPGKRDTSMQVKLQ